MLLARCGLAWLVEELRQGHPEQGSDLGEERASDRSFAGLVARHRRRLDVDLRSKLDLRPPELPPEPLDAVPKLTRRHRISWNLAPRHGLGPWQAEPSEGMPVLTSYVDNIVKSTSFEAPFNRSI